MSRNKNVTFNILAVFSPKVKRRATVAIVCHAMLETGLTAAYIIVYNIFQLKECRQHFRQRTELKTQHASHYDAHQVGSFSFYAVKQRREIHYGRTGTI